MVPQEQYDALKARFIESETQFQRKLEGINDLEKTIARREEQLATMEKMYLQKLEDAKHELEQFKATARDQEKSMQQELRTEKDERAKSEADLQGQITSANDELSEVRDARDALLTEKNKLDAFTFQQRDQIKKLENEVQRTKDDVECRKQIVDQMAKNMLAHE